MSGSRPANYAGAMLLPGSSMEPAAAAAAAEPSGDPPSAYFEYAPAPGAGGGGGGGGGGGRGAPRRWRRPLSAGAGLAPG